MSNQFYLRSAVGIVLPSLALLAVVGAATSQGQTSPSTTSASTPQIAVLDLVRIFNETAQIRDLNDHIKEKNDDYAKEAKHRSRVIEDKQTELSAFKPGSQDFESRRKNLLRLNIEANVWIKTAEQEIEQLRYDWTRVVYEKALQASREIAGERGIDVVMQKTEWKPLEIEQNLQNLRRVIQDRAVLYFSPQLDVTDSVIQRMDREYKQQGGRSSLGFDPKPLGP